MAACSPSWAAIGDASAEPPFGQDAWAFNQRGEPVPLEIEIERDGKYFWSGQVDGNGGQIRLATAPLDTCMPMIITSSSAGRLMPGHELPMRAELRLRLRYYAYPDWPSRFEMVFTYRRPVAEPGDNHCSDGVDIRTVTLSPHFTLKPGETIILREFDGFRISVSRK